MNSAVGAARTLQGKTEKVEVWVDGAKEEQFAGSGSYDRVNEGKKQHGRENSLDVSEGSLNGRSVEIGGRARFVPKWLDGAEKPSHLPRSGTILVRDKPRRAEVEASKSPAKGTGWRHGARLQFPARSRRSASEDRDFAFREARLLLGLQQSEIEVGRNESEVDVEDAGWLEKDAD
ncbi:hypothetical protein KM043_009699 [Ampulex compressa]|nr:hypothetical protein KM043_009699 [Ampulex compressa]